MTTSIHKLIKLMKRDPARLDTVLDVMEPSELKHAILEAQYVLEAVADDVLRYAQRFEAAAILQKGTAATDYCKAVAKVYRRHVTQELYIQDLLRDLNGMYKARGLGEQND
jgi:hypothetical protein